MKYGKYSMDPQIWDDFGVSNGDTTAAFLFMAHHQMTPAFSWEAIDFSIANEGSVTSTEEVRCIVEII